MFAKARPFLLALAALVGSSSLALADAGKGAAAKPGAYAIDGVHSFLIFKIHHFGAGNVYGTFDDIDGKVNVDADATKDSIDVSIKTASVHTHNPKRDQHLQSPDFFNAAQFPAITFKSTKVAKNGDGTLDVTGDLTIRGKTKSVTAKVTPIGAAEDPMKNYRVGFEGKVTINRNDFDVSFMPGALGDDVQITIALKGVDN